MGKGKRREKKLSNETVYKSTGYLNITWETTVKRKQLASYVFIFSQEFL